jgi:hypothetical protein
LSGDLFPFGVAKLSRVSTLQHDLLSNGDRAAG